MDVAIKFRGVTHSDATLWLKREFRAVASLRHRNLVELYELVAHERNCYFTMEYLPGIDPRRWVERRQLARDEPLPTDAPTRSASPLNEARTQSGEGTTELAGVAEPARALPVVDFPRVGSVLAQLAEGLAFLHAHGVIHRDVKPSNAICSGGVVKLLDFGLALERHRQAGDLARETRVVGTAAYLAPEYIERLAVSPAMDVYALGVLAFELITGAPPFTGSLHMLSRYHRRGVVPRAAAFNPHLPQELDALVARMLSPDPAARPTALQIANAFSGTQSHPRALRRAHRFVGRDRELALIAARIADPEPRGRLVLVRGESGAGKSALIDEVLGRARGRDTLTWRGRCHERERVPYRAFDLIIDDLATELAGDPGLAREIEHVGALGRVFPALAPLIDPSLGAEPPAADLRVERERALLAMTELFYHLLRTPRGVAVIDDLQWADEDSLELLALLVEHVGKPLTVLASWTVEAGEMPEAQQLLLERLGDAVTPVDVRAMTEDELAHLIAELVPQLPAARLRAAAALAAGSPYLAELIGRELGEVGPGEGEQLFAEGTMPKSGAPVASAELRRLARLDADERTVAEIAALAGGAVTFEQLRDIGDLPSSRVQSALRGLQDARIIRATPPRAGDPVYVFYHQRLREAAHDATPPPPPRAPPRQLAQW
jgi:hypothetical protein